MHKCVEEALQSEKNSNIDDEFYDLLNEYLDSWEKHRNEINQYDRENREFRRLRKQVRNWLSIIGLCEVENEDEIMIGYTETDDYDEQEIDPKDKSEDSSSIVEETDIKSSTQEQINELIAIIDSSDFDHLELKGFSSDGIFCLIDDYICRSTVDKYRNGNGWFRGR